MGKAVYVHAIASQRQLRLVSVLFVALVLAMPALILVLKGPQAFAKWSAWRWLEHGLMLVFAVAMPWVVQLSARAQLTIDDDGIALDPRLPGLLARLAPWGWSARWDQITKFSVVRLRGGAIVGFVLPGRAFTIRLPLQGWIPQHLAAAGAEPPKFKELEDNPIWQAFAAHGFTVATGRTLIDFDLARHPSTRAALTTCAVLGFGGLLLTIVESETYIADGYGFLVPHAVAGLVGMALFWKALAGVREPSRLPWGIPYGMAVFGGLASSMFSYGALVQLNKLAAPAVPAIYVVDSPCTTLLPADPALPRILWSSGYIDYWCQYKQGTELTIPVRKGLFGSWQFDQGAYVDKIREYRDDRRKK